MPTPDLFDFDPDHLVDYEPARARRALTNYPAIYINHLEVARWLEDWADNLQDLESSSHENSGFIEALRQVSGHLRQADFVPDGMILREARESKERALHEEWLRHQYD